MAKIFSKNQGPKVDLKRNTFDLSFANHVTGKIGQLIPVYCQEVLPGDSFQIDPKFGFRFNPLTFPIQTKMHGIMHFFYVRNRNLWNDWMEYIGRTNDDAVAPYLYVTPERAKKQLGTGSLMDYLGVPSTVTGSFARSQYIPLDTVLKATPVEFNYPAGISTGGTFAGTALATVNRKAPKYVYIGADITAGGYDYMFSSDISTWCMSTSPVPAWQNPSYAELYGYYSTVPVKYPLTSDNFTFVNSTGQATSKITSAAKLVFNLGRTADSPLSDTNPFTVIPLVIASENGVITASMGSGAAAKLEEVNSHLGSHSIYVGILFSDKDANVQSIQTLPSVAPTSSSFKCVGDAVTLNTIEGIVMDATETTTVGYNPFVIHPGETTPKIKLSALSARAYESIYNYFYRDETVAPYILNGKEVYNDFIPTHDGGPDSNDYVIRRKNWERDYFTSCQSSPQQGIAPLVGISANGTFTFNDGTNEYTASMTIGEDGETITGISTYSPDMPKGSLRQLMDVVTNGISINDLRNVNSLQRWLETNIRRGYKYVDQIYSHYGVNPSFKANDCPEFIGGIHSVADINQVNDTTSQNLGEYAGQMTMFGGSNNRISKFCDEGGFIIGICCVYPEPVYTQMLPKHFLKTETPLDYYFPEFGHIGMQPITYNEITPLEVAASDNAAGTDTLNDVFGYQRAWSDYLANYDQAHGDFRTTLSDFLVNRVFSEKPELGQSFIQIDDNDINDIFVTTDDSDKMLGEIRFDIKAQRPIPQYGIPRIE